MLSHRLIDYMYIQRFERITSTLGDVVAGALIFGDSGSKEKKKFKNSSFEAGS